MAGNNRFWQQFMSKEADKELLDNNIDPLEEGLAGISWVENSRRIVKEKIKKTQETLGEEIGNTITHGVMALFFLGMIPYVAVRAYTGAAEGMQIIDTVSLSIYMISMFLMFLGSTIYHAMNHDTAQKRVMARINHVMFFWAIAGSYTPICLSIIGGKLGLGICIAQWSMVLVGTLIKSIASNKSKFFKAISFLMYLIMIWMLAFCLHRFRVAATAPAFWLVLTGVICYTVGLIFYSTKFKFAHMLWHFFINFGAICHFIGLVYFLR
ncbi:MAG: hemolysin III family protein [Clostridia bacterium]|nr:hemolysin III family protein [Clostridia bacterium]